MFYRVLADLTLLVHFLFILFVVFGALLCLHSPRWAWLHVPAAGWGFWVETAGWICPLTPLELKWRYLAGQSGYEGGFIEHYLIGLVYPSGLTREIQIALGIGVLVINAALYLWIWRRRRSRSRSPGD